MTDFMKSPFIQACQNTADREAEFIEILGKTPCVQGAYRLNPVIVPWVIEKLMVNLEEDIWSDLED